MSFRNVTPCWSLDRYQRYGWPCCFHLHSTLKMEAEVSSKASTNIQNDRKIEVDCVWKVMAHAQKPDFVYRRNGRVHLNRQGRQSTTGSRGVRISDSNAGYTMFRGSVKGTGYPLHSPVSPSLPLPCVTVCHHVSTGFYITASSPAVSHPDCHAISTSVPV